jgi:hypothetical protein
MGRNHQVVIGQDADDPDRNPCTFKVVCRSCQFCQEESRPEACISLKCEDYTPCSKCKRNLPLDSTGKCQFCIPQPKPEMESVKKLSDVITKEQAEILETSSLLSDGEAFAKAEETRRFEITFPGTAPSQYSNSERLYYENQWKEYVGYYRDPTSYAICHQIILLEVELLWIAQFQHSRREKIIKELEQKQERLINNLRTLRQQLPEKEAQDLSDDEKSLGMIYERYVKEIKARRVGKLSRILTPEAYVLADSLHYKVNTFGLLQRLGYKPVEASDAVDKFFQPADLPTDPKDFLNFMGFHLKEKFAAPEGAVLDDLESGKLLGLPEEEENFLLESHPPLSSDDNPSPVGPSLSDGLATDNELEGE